MAQLSINLPRQPAFYCKTHLVNLHIWSNACTSGQMHNLHNALLRCTLPGYHLCTHMDDIINDYLFVKINKNIIIAKINCQKYITHKTIINNIIINFANH